MARATIVSSLISAFLLSICSPAFASCFTQALPSAANTTPPAQKLYNLVIEDSKGRRTLGRPEPKSHAMMAMFDARQASLCDDDTACTLVPENGLLAVSVNGIAIQYYQKLDDSIVAAKLLGQAGLCKQASPCSILPIANRKDGSRLLFQIHGQNLVTLNSVYNPPMGSLRPSLNKADGEVILTALKASGICQP